MNTKRQLFTMLMPAALVATSDSASAQIPAIPEPGIVLYGKILAADGQSTVPASEVQLRLNSAPAQTGQVVAGADGVHFYVIKIPFESRLGGVLDDTPLSDFTDADSTYQLSTAPGSNRVSFGGEEDRTISAVDSAESTSSFQFGSGEARGKVVRMDILTDFNLSGVPTFEAWIVGYPSIPANQRGRDDDADGDGHSNGFEWIAGLDPTDASKANPLATFILDITDSKVPVNAKELSFRLSWRVEVIG
ncbi:MAG: hypothetical protein R3F19_06335 [Verrucomicrobiales bacterium]